MPLSLIKIWDSADPPPDQAVLIYRWSGYEETGTIHSLLRYADDHGSRLRNNYLSWIHDLGNSRIHGKRLIDYFVLDNGLSFWWLSLFVEKSSYKSPISAAIRLLALEEILKENKPKRLCLLSANRDLHKAICSLCKSLGIAYEWERTRAQSHRLNLRSIYQLLPQPVRAVISLFRYLLDRWPFRRLSDTDWFGGDQALFFCSYFIHLEQASCANGRYQSSLWGDLPRLLHKRGFRTNWIQHYLQSSVVPDTGIAIDWVQRFNRIREEEGFHTFLDAYLSLRVIWRILMRWLWLNWVTWRLGMPEEAFHPQSSHVSMWPLMRRDWKTSLCGPDAIMNLFWIELFDQAMKHLPHQKRGFYLCENQSWERALIYMWRKHGHGQLIGIPHSTVRFWDLRYFSDPRTIQSSDSHPLPQPDLTVLNGKAAVDAYHSVNYPMNTVVEAEALRYGYLNNFLSANRLKPKHHEMPKVLVLGDYDPTATINLLKLIEKSALINPGRYSYIVKPHPSYLVEAKDFPSLNLKVVVDHLGEILPDCDVACASNSTSASVDAYVAGVPVVVMLDDTTLNFNPLRGQPKVRFFSTPEELSESLQAAIQDSEDTIDHNEFFFLDSELPRWKCLLASDLP
ncbi:MAG: TIGR04326 family surface carbohydrate biosynthesis protein [Pseudomonadota bacterium]